MNRKSLKFAPPLVASILRGEKFCTWRFFDDKNLSVDDELELINKETGACFGYAKIQQVREKPLGDINEQDFIGHERYESEAQMYTTLRGFYGDRVTPETVVKIITFSFRQR